MYRTMQRGAGSLSGCMVDATGLDDKTRVSLWVGLLGLIPRPDRGPVGVVRLEVPLRSVRFVGPPAVRSGPPFPALESRANVRKPFGGPLTCLPAR